MSSTTVRISRECQEVLRELATREGKTIQAVLERAISDAAGLTFWKTEIVHMVNFRANPQDWAEELAERTAWGATLGDGLDEGE